MSHSKTMHIILPKHVNGDNRLFGGQLLSWIDISGAIAARKFANTLVTTLLIDNLHFLAPAFINDIVIIESKVTWSGNTSIEVHTKTFIEKNNEPDILVNSAYSIFVAIDENGKPISVPKFIPKTPEEIQEYEAAIIRKKLRQQSSLK